MLSVITAAALSAATSFAVAKYKYNLRQRSNNETIIIVKNVDEFADALAPESNIEVEEPSENIEREYIRFAIPIPFEYEIQNFFNWFSAIPFFFVLSFSIIMVIEDENVSLPEISIYTLITIILYFLYLLLAESGSEIWAKVTRYTITLVSMIYSAYLFNYPPLFTDPIFEGNIAEIIILTSISLLAMGFNEDEYLESIEEV